MIRQIGKNKTVKVAKGELIINSPFYVYFDYICDLSVFLANLEHSF